MQKYREHFGDKTVTVAVTPNGYADGIACSNEQLAFFLPEELDMSFNHFLSTLQEKRYL